MKLLYTKALSSANSAQLAEGRYIGTVIQIAGLGNQPAFEPGNPPEPSIGVVVQLADTQLTKKMRLISSTYGKLFEYLRATLPDHDNYDGDELLPLTLGMPVAVEISVKGQFANIVSFHRPEPFDLPDAPQVAAADLILLDSPDSLTGDVAKALFMRLHRDIRSWISKRVQERT